MKIFTKTLTLIRLRCSAVVRLRLDRLGFEFPHNGDLVIWLWPWKRNGLPKYISVGFSGTGEFGDARFNTLTEIDKAWADLSNPHQENR